jgi:hypothetical protein
MRHARCRSLLLVVLLGLLPACAVSRHDQLRSRARQVEKTLTAERDRALTLEPPRSRERLDHLSSMRIALTAVNLALAAVPRLVEPPDRPLAYDTIEQAYDTIEWNIPLPASQTRALPPAFLGNRFDPDRLVDR